MRDGEHSDNNVLKNVGCYENFQIKEFYFILRIPARKFSGKNGHFK